MTIDLDLDLDPELEAMLQQLAADSNLLPEDFATHLLTQRIEAHYAQRHHSADPQARPDEGRSDQTTPPTTTNT